MSGNEELLTSVEIPNPAIIETLNDDMITKIFSPCLSRKRCKKYVRGAGFFSSSIYRLMTAELLEFCIRGGTVTLLTSTIWQEKDYNAIKDQEIEQEIEDPSIEDPNYWMNQLEILLEQKDNVKPTKMLVALVKSGRLKIKIGIFRENYYHEKTGFFEDEEKNVILFYGTGNESRSAFRGQGNSFNIYCNFKEDIESAGAWKGHGIHNMKNLVRDIEGKGNFIVKDFDDNVVERFIEKRKIEPNLDSHRAAAVERSKKLSELYDEHFGDSSQDEEKEQEGNQKKDPVDEDDSNDSHENVEDWVQSRDHQKEALEKWEDVGKRGILKHATGSGKTVTAIAAIERHLKEDEENFSIVVVPLVKLQSQWQKEIEKFGMETILIGGDSGASMQELVIDQLSKNLFFDKSVLIVVKDTFIGDSFRKAIKSGSQTRERCLLVFDECHRASEPRFQWLLDNEVVFKSTLGLSATPYPSTDEEQETSDEIWDLDDIKQSYEFDNLVRKERVIKLLGDVIHEFSLADGIAKGYLTPYQYHLERVHMSNQEQIEYDEFRKQIGKFMNMASNPAIHQARMVIKSVGAKLRGLEKVLNDHYLPGQHWLVYCAHSAYLDETRNIIRKITGDWWEYTSKNIESREEHIARFEEDGGILLAVKCLDEGVDIPMITHGVILSSSMVEREFVQRRGRMLRVDKEKKKKEAHIYDFAVIPHQSAGRSATQSILNGELKRIEQFMLDADNEKIVKFTYDALEKTLNKRVKKRSRRR